MSRRAPVQNFRLSGSGAAEAGGPALDHHRRRMAERLVAVTTPPATLTWTVNRSRKGHGHGPADVTLSRRDRLSPRLYRAPKLRAFIDIAQEIGLTSLRTTGRKTLSE
ncbi:hypothetical protein FKO01_04390 [Mesorhizobium sp. B2-3-3]|nr:hypothetical protein FKO01_04390 [Mesorhizobium sp. B2-3-3]